MEFLVDSKHLYDALRTKLFVDSGAKAVNIYDDDGNTTDEIICHALTLKKPILSIPEDTEIIRYRLRLAADLIEPLFNKVSALEAAAHEIRDVVAKMGYGKSA